MTPKIEKLTSAALALAAMLVAIAALYRVFGSAPTAQAQGASIPVFVPDWHAALKVGERVGRTDAPVTIVEFVDVECPSCRRFQATINERLQRYPDKVSVVYVHYPLSYHRFALPAARALECATKVNGYHALANALFAKQDSLGLRSWGAFARDADLRDTAAIASCATTDRKFARIEGGLEVGTQIGVESTPTVLVNGWKYNNRTPSATELTTVVDAFLQGKRPFARP